MLNKVQMDLLNSKWGTALESNLARLIKMLISFDSVSSLLGNYAKKKFEKYENKWVFPALFIIMKI